MKSAFVCIAALMAAPLAFGQVLQPSWWQPRGAISAAAADDFAALTVGQLKQMATAANAEITARLPTAPALAAPLFTSTTGDDDDTAVANLGQLKNAAKLTNDRIRAAGGVMANLQNQWSGSADDFAVANLGQLKQVFNWNLPLNLNNGTRANNVKKDVERELMITNLKVVESNRAKIVGSTVGPWHIKTLLTHIFKLSPTSPTYEVDLTNRTLSWLALWTSPQTVNGNVSPARPNMNAIIVNPWKNNSTGAGTTNFPVSGIIDWTKAPFRLLGIVYRPDISALSAGFPPAPEARFVFTLTSGPATTGAFNFFNVILEYKLQGSTNDDWKRWARLWHSVGSTPNDPFSASASAADVESYLAQLEQVTTAFSGPNGVLGQLRTNEIALSSPWELREFHTAPALTGSGQRLVQAEVKQTPPNVNNPVGTGMNAPVTGAPPAAATALAQWIANNQTDIGNETFIVPTTVPNAGGTATFGSLGASVLNPPTTLSAALPVHWNIATNVTSPALPTGNARTILFNKFSRNTCNGCHFTAAAAPDTFTHVRPRTPTQEATLSNFLTGLSTTPSHKVISGTSVVDATVNDLDFRRQVLESLLDLPTAPPPPGGANIASFGSSTTTLTKKARVH